MSLDIFVQFDLTQGFCCMPKLPQYAQITPVCPNYKLPLYAQITNYPCMPKLPLNAQITHSKLPITGHEYAPSTPRQLLTSM